MRQLYFIAVFFIMACTSKGQQTQESMSPENKMFKTSDEWKTILTPEQYNVCVLKGTEAPGSGKYDKFFDKGYYRCVACGNRLFNSDTKFDSGSGWPSFFDTHETTSLSFITDTSYGMVRTEVTCAKCSSHLGHVFTDGPKPTGLRYCINSLALEFVPFSDKEH